MGSKRRWAGWVVVIAVALIAPAVWIISLSCPASLNSSRAEVDDPIVDFTARRLACNYGEISFEYVHIQTPLKFYRGTVTHGGQTRQIQFKREKWVSPPHYHLLGFAYNRSPAPGRTIWTLFLPLWPFALLGLIPLLLRVGRVWIARDRSRRLQCGACGYDMRSSPARCPECGALPGGAVIADSSAPAVAAVARSSGTKCVALMAGYVAAVVFLVAFTPPMREFLRSGRWEADVFAYLYYVFALMFLILGSFHAATYSRSIEGFFGCGAICTLLLAPLYVHIGRSQPVWVQLVVVIAAAIVLGFMTSAAAMLRWRIQDRADRQVNTVGPAPVRSQ